MVASQSHVLHWQRCTAAAAATAPGATGGHGVGSHVADAENSGAPPPLPPPPVATSALNEGIGWRATASSLQSLSFSALQMVILFSLFSSALLVLIAFSPPPFPSISSSRGAGLRSAGATDGANIDGGGHDRQSWLLFKAAMHYGHMHPLHAQSIFVQLDCLSLRNMSGCKGCVVGGFFL